jgi:glycosyltransferase involved in cell wall biosynthesis
MRQVEPIAVAILPRKHEIRIPQVAILLCTLEGQRFLKEQLASFESQNLKAWSLFVSDDGSSDRTLDILQEQQKQWGRGKLTLQSGPRQGFAANFLSLTCQTDINADYYAYADQDDIWEADKLERAVHWLETIPGDVPALYCSRTRLVDKENRTVGFSPLFKKPPSFANALIQNIGGGNTMVFNHATKKLLCRAGKDIEVNRPGYRGGQLV